jgi:hypothetical protein
MSTLNASIPLHNMEIPSSSELPGDGDARQPALSLGGLAALNSAEIVDYLTAKGFFNRFSHHVRAQVIRTQLDGELLVRQCWDPEFNKEGLGMSAGPAFGLAYLVEQVYKNEGMS